MDPVTDLVGSWRDDADVLERHGHDREAQRLRRQAEAVEDALRRRRTQPLTVAQAAEESGYSERRLRELLSEGKLPNAGGPGAPRIRRRDLPAKPGSPDGPTLDVQQGGASLAEEALARRRS